MLVDNIPLNPNGKLDIFRLTRERIGGDAYDIVPVFKDGRLTDIQTKYVRSVNSMTAGSLPQGMENHSAYNIFDLFNTAAPSVRTARGSFHDPFGFSGSLFSEENGGRKFLRMPEIPENVMSALLKYGNRMAGIPAGRKKMDHDFEE